MIKLEDHIKEIDGVKYVPLDVANAFVAETYNKQFSKITQTLNKAWNDYDKSIKEIMND